jgi:hypothetical protein
VIKRQTTHGLTGHPLHDVWTALKQRCNTESNEFFYNYGGRGITVCVEWLDFYTFKKWALANGFKEDLYLDRIDNNEGYSPNNCRWVSAILSNRNTRKNRFITYRGETLCLAEWAERLDIPAKRLSARLTKLNWAEKRALETPYIPRPRKKHETT